MSKINEAMSDIERSFDAHDRKFDRLEIAIIGLYVINVGMIATVIFTGGFL